MGQVTLTGTSGTYGVGVLLASTADFQLYFARETVTGRHCLLQVATELQANGGLDRAAFLLKRLADKAVEYDKVYEATHGKKHLHYDRLYPAIIDSFISSQEGGRRVNILSLADIDDVMRIVPLSNLRQKDRLRIDPQTSAWIMGRLLKLLAYIHGEGIAHRALSARNVLLDPEQHFAVTLDWASAYVYPSTVPDKIAARDVAQVASVILGALGVDKGHEYLEHAPYIALLKRFAGGKVASAELALDQFYELVRREYGTRFHPFTTLPL